MKQLKKFKIGQTLFWPLSSDAVPTFAWNSGILDDFFDYLFNLNTFYGVVCGIVKS